MKNTSVLNHKNKFIFVYTWSLREKEISAFEKVINKIGNYKIIFLHKELFSLFRETNKVLSNEEKIRVFWDNFIKKNYLIHRAAPEIFSNQFLTFQFDAIKNEINDSISSLDIFLSFITYFSPILICFGHEAFTFERGLVKLANINKIPTISFYHGGLGPIMGHQGNYGESKYLFVWNDIDRNSLISFGVSKKNIINLGSIRYEEQYLKFLAAKQIKKYVKPKKIILKLGLDITKPTITFLTAALNMGFAQPMSDPKKHRAAIHELLVLMEQRTDLQFIFKSHPGSDYYDLYKLFEESKLPNIFLSMNYDLEDILSVTDICVPLNYLTTATLEAMLANIPIIYFNNASYSLADWKDGLHKDDLIRVKSIKKLEHSIDKLLINNSFTTSRLNNIKSIKNLLGFQNGISSVRLEEELKKIINNTNVLGVSRRKKNPIYLLKNSTDDKFLFESKADYYLHLTYIYQLGYFKHGLIDGIRKLKINEVLEIGIRKTLYVFAIGYISSREKSLYDKLRLAGLVMPNFIFFISSPKFLKNKIAKYILR